MYQELPRGRRVLLAGGITDGSSLPKQDELVAEFGVSHPSVREALRIPETEGFVTVRRGNRGGAVVHAPDIGTAGYALGLTLQAMQVRVPDLGATLAVLEPICVAQAAARPRRDRGTAAAGAARRERAAARRRPGAPIPRPPTPPRGSPGSTSPPPRAGSAGLEDRIIDAASSRSRARFRRG